MKHKNGAFRLALAIFSCLGAASCGPSVHKMAPSLEGLNVASVHKTLQLAPVSGGRNWKRGDRTIEDDEFAEAITQALDKSRLFARVSKARGGDYLLKAHIINQGTLMLPVSAGTEGLPGHVLGAVFVVRYTLETVPGKVEFQKEIGAGCHSEKFLLSLSNSDVNATFECAVQGNLRKLIRELARAVGDRSAHLDPRR
jgi:hypothetical protein